MLCEQPLGLKRRTFLPFLEAEEAVRTKYKPGLNFSIRCVWAYFE